MTVTFAFHILDYILSVIIHVLLYHQGQNYLVQFLLNIQGAKNRFDVGNIKKSEKQSLPLRKDKNKRSILIFLHPISMEILESIAWALVWYIQAGDMSQGLHTKWSLSEFLKPTQLV